MIPFIIYVLLIAVNLKFAQAFYHNIYYDKFEGISTVGLVVFSFVPIFPAAYVIFSLNSLSKLKVENLKHSDKYVDDNLKDGFNFLDGERTHCCYVKDNKIYKFAMYPDIRATNNQKIFNKQMLILKNLNRTFITAENSYNIIEEDNSQNIKDDI